MDYELNGPPFIHVCLLFTGKYSPPFYFHFCCPRCQRANSNASHYLSLNTTHLRWPMVSDPHRFSRSEAVRIRNPWLAKMNTTVSWRIQNEEKPFTSVKGRKITVGENNPVYSINYMYKT